MSAFIENLHKPAHKQWNTFLTQDNIESLENIENQTLNAPITPPLERVLHFMTIDPSKVKIVIIGQDPYPQEGVATGRCFEVGTLSDWNQPFRNVSLRNIIRLIYKTYYNQTLSFKEIVALNNKTKIILPPNELFKNWEKQGVLLLNTAFTCEIGISASHSKIWNPFSNKILSFIQQINPNAHWIAWGNHARNMISTFKIQNLHASNHPMMCSKKSESDFLYGTYSTMEATKHLVDWRGRYEK